MASVITRKRGSNWEYRFEAAKINGKRTQISKSGFKTKKAATEAGAKALSEYNLAGSYFTPSEISTNDFFNIWINDYCKVNLKKTSIENYTKRINLHIKPALGRYKLSALSPAILQNFLNKLFNDGYSRNTLSTIRRILSGALNYAVDTLQYLQTNPMKAVKLPSERAVPDTPTRTAPNTFISQEQIKAIFNRFPEGSSPFIPMQFGYKCGLRIGEAFGVFWEDIDFEARTLTVKRQVQWDIEGGYWYFSNPKYNSVRTIDIDKELVEILKREYEKQQRAIKYYGDLYLHLYENEKRAINTNEDGQKIHLVNLRENGEFIVPRTMQHTSRIIHYNLGFKNFTFHSFRHTHATMLAESGAPIKYAQERLGHKDIAVTLRIYQHVSESIKESGINIIDKMFDHNKEDT